MDSKSIDNRSLLSAQYQEFTGQYNRSTNKSTIDFDNINESNIKTLQKNEITSYNFQDLKLEVTRAQTLEEFVFENELNINKNIIKQHNSKYGSDFFYITVSFKEDLWEIRRRWHDVEDLHKKLKKEKLIQIPELEKESSIKFRQEWIVDFFNNFIFQNKILQDNVTILEFLEFSKQNHEKKEKVRECYMEKKAGGRFAEGCCTRAGILCGKWSRRYFSISTQGVYYCSDSSSNQIKDQLMFDNNFEVLYGKNDTGMHNGIMLKSSHRNLLIKQCDTFIFVDFLVSVREAASKSPYITKNLYDSFAPVRQNALCKWYVDGKDYFADVLKFINLATKEIFITDWWLSPKLHMVRPLSINNIDKRLDQVLAKKARQGVTIKILHWQDHPIAGLANQSHYTKSYLESLHSNIKVLRHPNYTLPFKWSHHEKMVIIDQAIGFMGGLDLCYGRWDDQNHDLFDIDDEQHVEIKEKWPGIDYCNPRTKDFNDVKTKNEDPDIPKTQPRMPWHDIAMRVIGEPVIDMCRHFIQYWNHVNVDNEYSKRAENVITVDHQNQNSFFNKLKQKIRDREISKDNVEKQPMNVLKIKSNSNDGEQEWYLRPKTHTYEDKQSLKQTQEIESFEEPSTGDLEQIQLLKDKQSSEKQKNPATVIGRPLSKVQEELETQSQSNYNDDNEQQNSSLLQRHQDDSWDNEGSQQKQSILQIQQQPKEEEERLQQENKDQQTIQDKKQAIRKISRSFNPQTDISKEINLEDDNVHNLQEKKYKSDLEMPNQQQGNFGFHSVMPQKQVIDVKLQTQKSASVIRPTEDIIDPEFIDILKEAENKKIHKQNQVSDFYQSRSTGNNQSERNSNQSQLYSSKKKLREIKSKKLEKDAPILQHNIDHQIQHGNINCQMVRSASLWSVGINETEDSIHQAYISLIGESQHYIYIENQFFMSSNAGDPIDNQIALSLVTRIKKAYNNNQNFKVFVVMPLMPAFSGEVDSDTAAIMKIQLYWEYKTISRGGNSIYEQLINYGIEDPMEYIQFFGLRTHGVNKLNEPHTEQIYIHSKLMIVDDKKVIMGSANINDRSLLGNRDSEVGMVIEDQEQVNTFMNNQPYKAAKFAYSLRTEIFREHFGLPKSQIIDPLNQRFNTVIRKKVRLNTEIYRHVFRCYPDDNIKQFKDLKSFRKQMQIQDYEEKVKQIVGHAVEFPLNFLNQESLKFKTLAKENIVPEDSFT